MNNPNDPAKEELAERLWTQQGAHKEHSSGDWLEAEYRAHPPIATVENEADLRMRGLGPLTNIGQSEPPAQAQRTERETLFAGQVLLAAGVCVGMGVLYSMLRRFFSRHPASNDHS